MKAKKNYRLNRAAIAAIAALAIAAAWAIVSAVGKTGDAESLRREFFEKKDLDAGMSCAKAMLANGDAQGAQILRMLADIGREDAAKRLAKTLKNGRKGPLRETSGARKTSRNTTLKYGRETPPKTAKQRSSGPGRPRLWEAKKSTKPSTKSTATAPKKTGSSPLSISKGRRIRATRIR